MAERPNFVDELRTELDRARPSVAQRRPNRSLVLLVAAGVLVSAGLFAVVAFVQGDGTEVASVAQIEARNETTSPAATQPEEPTTVEQAEDEPFDNEELWASLQRGRWKLVAASDSFPARDVLRQGIYLWTQVEPADRIGFYVDSCNGGSDRFLRWDEPGVATVVADETGMIIGRPLMRCTEDRAPGLGNRPPRRGSTLSFDLDGDFVDVTLVNSFGTEMWNARFEFHQYHLLDGEFVVPQLGDIFIDDAVSQVESAGLVAEIRFVDHPDYDPEYVISTDPVAGVLLEEGSTVVITARSPIVDPVDPEEVAFIALEQLIETSEELMGYYIDDQGDVVVALSPLAARSESEAVIRRVFNRNFTVSQCPRSSAELAAVLDGVVEMLRRMNVDGPTISGIDAKNCAVHFGALLSADQEAELAATFGDALIIDGDFAAFPRIPVDRDS